MNPAHAMISELFRTKSKIFFRHALNTLRNQQDAWDVVSETFRKGIERLHLYNPVYSLSTWVSWIFRNTLNDFCKERGRAARLFTELPREYDANADLESLCCIPEMNITDDISALLTQAQIPSRDQDIILLLLNGYSTTYIASLNNIHPSQVSRIKKKYAEKIRKIIRRLKWRYQPFKHYVTPRSNSET